MDDMTPAQRQLQRDIVNEDKVPIKVQMRIEGFKFIMDKERILDRLTYMRNHGVILVDAAHTTLGKYEARLIYSDNSSKIISIREKIEQPIVK